MAFEHETKDFLGKADPGFFSFDSHLAEILRPRWGGSHLCTLVRPVAAEDDPWEDLYQRDSELMDQCGLLARAEYLHEDPRGLMMRAFIGPLFVQQLGAVNIESLPLIVRKLAGNLNGTATK